MKRFSIALPLVALLLAFAASAFTREERAPEQTMYWFPTNAQGTILQETIIAEEHQVQPCDGLNDYCAVGFTDAQVTDNGDGTVTLNSGLDKDDGLASKRNN